MINLYSIQIISTVEDKNHQVSFLVCYSMGINGSLMSQMLLAVSSTTICWRAFNLFSLRQTFRRTDWAWEPLHNPEGLTHLLKERDSCGGSARFQRHARTTTRVSNQWLLPQRRVVLLPTDDSADVNGFLPLQRWSWSSFLSSESSHYFIKALNVSFVKSLM